MQSTLLFMLEGKHKKSLDKFKTEKKPCSKYFDAELVYIPV